MVYTWQILLEISLSNEEILLSKIILCEIKGTQSLMKTILARMLKLFVSLCLNDDNFPWKYFFWPIKILLPILLRKINVTKSFLKIIFARMWKLSVNWCPNSVSFSKNPLFLIDMFAKYQFMWLLGAELPGLEIDFVFYVYIKSSLSSCSWKLFF